MSIYSANRSATAGTVVESKYNNICIDQIMYESEVNSMKIFEAAIGSDFMEIQGLREGTLLKEEADEKEKKTLSDYLNRIIEALKKFWDKMRAFFASKLEEAKNAFIKVIKPSIIRFNKIPNDKFDEGKTFTIPRSFVKAPDQGRTEVVMIKKIANEFTRTGEFKRADLINKILGAYYYQGKGQGSLTPDEFKKKMKEKYFPENTGKKEKNENTITLTKENIKTKIVDVMDMSNTISEYKKTEAEMNDIIDDVIKAAKETKENNAANMSKFNEISSAYQTAISIIAKVQIQNAYAGIIMYNGYLNQIINMLEPSTKNESFVLEGDSVVDNAECDTPDVADSSAEFDKMVADTMVEVEDIISDDNKEE